MTTQIDWKEKFDEEFPSPDGRDFIGVERITDIKRFISEVEQEACLRGKEEGLGEALSELKKLKVRRFTYWRPWGMGVDDAISKVKSLLTSTQP